jgi:filamentous hemagglutinin family protein
MRLPLVPFSALTTLTTIVCTIPLTATAQIVPDNTLGNENSVVVPNQNIRGIDSDRIDGGAVRGSNLFHSFEEFNIDEGRGAYFSNPDNIINILTRVTGGNISQILGTLGVLGNANLFLINPNGIVFGPNARLDVGGSFFASTADGILFENGIEFRAINPQNPPLLTINIPLGLQLRNNPESIQVKSAQLRVPNGQTLAFVGGNINLNEGMLLARDGRVELGSVNGGIVGIEQNRLNIPANLQRSNIVLRDNARIEVSGTGRGTINIFARNLSITNSEMALKAGISQKNQSEGSSTPGDIQLNATESVIITNSKVSNSVDSGGVGNGGKIIIQANNLSMSEGAALDSRVIGSGSNNQHTAGQGNAGAVIIEVTGAVHLDRSFINTNIGTNVIGNSGDINIQAGSLLMRGGSQLNSNTSGGNFEQPSQAGEVRLNIRNRLNLEGLGTDTDPAQQTKITTEVDNGGVGQAGQVKIEVTNGSFLMNNGAALVTRVRRAQTDENTGEIIIPAGQGNGGDVNLKVRDNIIFENNSLILATVGDEVLGTRSGNVNLESNAVYLNNSSRIITATGGSPNALQTPSVAGNISLQVRDSVHLSQSQIISSATPRATRTNGGNITINTPSILLEDSAVTAGDGTLNPAEENSAGQIIINAPNLQFNAGILQADTQRGRIETASITINSQDLRLQNQSNFTTNANLTDGGNITINAETLVSLNNSDITANADGGAGGAILINTEGIFGATPLTRQQVEERLGEQKIQGNPRFSQDLLQTTSDIVAISTTDAALSGTVDLNSALDPSKGLVDLPQQVIDPAALIAQDPCKLGRDSEFFITGRGGIVPDPTQPLSITQGLIEWESFITEPTPPQPNNSSQRRQQQSQKQDNNRDDYPVDSRTIVPARGWIRTEDGDVILVGYDPTKTGVQRQPNNPHTCQPSK